MSNAKKYLDEKRKEEFYSEISKALWEYAANKLGIPPADLSIDFVRTKLESKNIQPDVINKFASTIEICEFARFAPSQDNIQMEKIYEEAIDLISKIEEHL